MNEASSSVISISESWDKSCGNAVVPQPIIVPNANQQTPAENDAATLKNEILN